MQGMYLIEIEKYYTRKDLVDKNCYYNYSTMSHVLCEMTQPVNKGFLVRFFLNDNALHGWTSPSST